MYKYILFQTITATHCFHSTGTSGRGAKKPLPCLWFKTLSERDPEELLADTYIHTHNIYIYMEKTYDEQVERSLMYKIIKKKIRKDEEADKTINQSFELCSNNK